MAQSRKQLENLKKGNPATQFVSGREAVEKGKKGRQKRAEKRKRMKSLEETVRMAFKIGLTDIGENRMRRSGLNVDDIAPDDMNGMTAVVIGQMNAAMNGNSQAAQVLADWYDLSVRHKRDQLELEKLQAEIDRLRNGSDADDDQVLQFIEGMKHGKPDTEAD